MNAKIRDRIKHFLKFEGGRVGLKTPLARFVTSPLRWCISNYGFYYNV